MTSRVTVSAHCADDTNVHVVVSTDVVTRMETLENGESKDYHVYDNITISVAEVKKFAFASEQEAIELLSQEGVTLDSNKWMDLKTAGYELSPVAQCAAAYLCTKHGFVVNT